MTTADALRINESMEKLVEAMGIKDPELKKVVLDQFNEEASQGMHKGLTTDFIIQSNDEMIKEGFDWCGGSEVLEAAVREEAERRKLI